jgi:hypothetical protein
MNTELRCSECGAEANATCACGVAYIPAGEYARKVAAMQPGVSNRALAEQIGVSYQTVRRARQSVDTNVSTESRTGKDGKMYSPRKPHKAPSLDKAREIVREAEAIGIPLNATALAQDSGVGRRTMNEAIAVERVRKETLEEVGAVARASGLSVAAEKKLEIYKQELAQNFTHAVDQRVSQHMAEILATRDQRDIDLINQAYEVLNHKYGAPLSALEYMVLMKALHPDSTTPENRDEAFKLVNLKKLLLRREGRITTLTSMAKPLPRSLAEWEAAKKAATEARRRVKV